LTTHEDFKDAVTRTGRFLVTNLGVLLLLSGLIGHEIRDYNVDAGKFENRLKNLENKKKSALDNLGRKNAEIAAIIRTAHKGATRTNLEASITQLRSSIKSIKTEAEQEFLEDAGSRTNLPVQQFLTEVGRLRANLPARFPGQHSNQVAALLEKMETEAAVVQQLPQKIHAVKKELDQFNRERKPEIPTPFGSFKIKPELALLATTFYALFAYLFFQYQLIGIYHLARFHCTSDSKQSIWPGMPAPFWGYSVDAAPLAQCFGWNETLTRARRAAILHLLWLALLGWLVWETFWHWKAHLLFRSDAHQSVWPYIALAMYLASIYLMSRVFWRPVLPNRWKQWSENRFNRVRTMDRRDFVRISAAGFVLTASLYALWIYRRAAAHARFLLNPADLNLAREAWVVHARTKATHHPLLCAGHLPQPHNLDNSPQLPEKAALHTLHLHRLLNSLIQDARARKDDARTIELLRVATKYSPESWHYFDRLVRLLGRLKRYDEINVEFARMADAVAQRSSGNRSLMNARLQQRKTAIASRQDAASRRAKPAA
jgi:hypothetical protein